MEDLELKKLIVDLPKRKYGSDRRFNLELMKIYTELFERYQDLNSRIPQKRKVGRPKK